MSIQILQIYSHTIHIYDNVIELASCRLTDRNVHWYTVNNPIIIENVFNKAIFKNK